MDSSFSAWLWAALVIGGPLLLLIAYAFGIFGSSQIQRSTAAKGVRERGAQRVYEAEERESRMQDDQIDGR
jgi:hypothetical protein